MTRPTSALAALGFSVGFLVLSVTAAELRLPAVADTSLFSLSPSNNLGASLQLAVGATGKGTPARTLLRFEIPADLASDVTSVRLRFTVSRAPDGGVPSTFRAHRLLLPWSEGRGSGDLGSAAIDGEPTWRHRRSVGTPWNLPGGSPGVDYLEAPSGTVSVQGTGAYEIAAPGLAADLQLWRADPASNFGWILISDREDVPLTARRLGSRESAQGPELLVTTSDDPPLRLEQLGRTSSGLQFQFFAPAGYRYVVEGRSPAAVSGWQFVTQYVAKLASTQVVVAVDFSPGDGQLLRVARDGQVD